MLVAHALNILTPFTASAATHRIVFRPQHWHVALVDQATTKQFPLR